MKHTSTKLENYFSRLGQVIYQHRYWVILTVLVFTAGLVSQLPKLYIDTSSDAFYHADDSIRVEYNKFRQQFGQNDHIIEGFIYPIPSSSESLIELSEKARNNPFYQNYLLSEDEQFTFFDIEPIAIVKSMADISPLILLLNPIFLTLFFRRVSGVIFPSIIVTVTIVGTVGSMAWLSIPLDLVTTILPPLLSVVAIADSVHLLSGFYQEYDKNGGDKAKALSYSMGRNGVAIFMTNMTTSIGLASFMLADNASIVNLGIAAPVGIILVFFYTLLLLPALIAIFPMQKPDNDYIITGIVDQIIDWVADVSCQRYKGILLTSFLLLIVGVVGSTQLQPSYSALTWLPEGSAVRNDTSVIDTEKKYGIDNPELLHRLGPMLVDTMVDVHTSLLKSYSVALFAITTLMIAFMGNLKIGVISAASCLMPIILVSGLMGFLGIPLDFSTVLVASIVISLAVDDTIHFLHNLKRQFDRTGNIGLAISNTLHTTGRAIFTTSLVVLAGMSLAMTTDLSSIANFSFIGALVIVFELLTDYFMVPALMYALYKDKIT